MKKWSQTVAHNGILRAEWHLAQQAEPAILPHQATSAGNVIILSHRRA
jgi:hypothetical protein